MWVFKYLKKFPPSNIPWETFTFAFAYISPVPQVYHPMSSLSKQSLEHEMHNYCWPAALRASAVSGMCWKWVWHLRRTPPVFVFLMKLKQSSCFFRAPLNSAESACALVVNPHLSSPLPVTPAAFSVTWWLTWCLLKFKKSFYGGSGRLGFPARYLLVDDGGAGLHSYFLLSPILLSGGHHVHYRLRFWGADSFCFFKPAVTHHISVNNPEANTTEAVVYLRSLRHGKSKGRHTLSAALGSLAD